MNLRDSRPNPPLEMWPPTPTVEHNPAENAREEEEEDPFGDAERATAW